MKPSRLRLVAGGEMRPGAVSGRSSPQHRGQLSVGRPTVSGVAPQGRKRDDTSAAPEDDYAAALLELIGIHGVSRAVTEHLLRDGCLDTITAMDAWLAYLRASYAPATVRNYWQAAFRFLMACPKPLFEVTDTDVAEWLETFPFRSSRRRSYYHALKCLFDWSVTHGICEETPVTIRVPTAVEKVPEALSADEIVRVRSAAYDRDPRHGLTLDLLYYTAARISEAQHLTWEDDRGDSLVLRKTKNGKERDVPMTEGLRHALDGLHAYFGTQAHVLPRSGETINRWLRNAGEAADVPGVHAHLIRSTAATRMLVNGGRPHAVREVLGHASLRTTQRYWAVEVVDKQEAVNAL